jgi:uncharacterized protein (TIGR03083 family)
MTLSHERYCDLIIARTDMLRSHIEGADLAAPVPTCPNWTLAQMLRHLGLAQRWVETIVSTRATKAVPNNAHDVLEYAEKDPAVLGDWLAEGAAQLTRTLREAGPDAEVWTFSSIGRATFWTRRMAHETVMHGADVALVVDADFSVDEDVAADAIDEWLQLGALRMELQPERREILAPGRTIHLHATDTAPGTEAEWLIDLGGDTIAWRHGHEKATAGLRGPLTDLLLAVYRRRSAHREGIEILGDAQLLEFWLDRAKLG